MMNVFVWVILLTVLVQLFLIARDDLQHLRISNRANLILAMTYLPYAALTQDAAEIMMHVITAGLIFFALLWPFARNMLGGGDVKFLSTGALWIGPQNLSFFMITLLVSLILYLAGARMGLLRMHQEGKLHRIPFGPSGALALATTLAARVPLSKLFQWLRLTTSRYIR